MSFSTVTSSNLQSNCVIMCNFCGSCYTDSTIASCCATIFQHSYVAYDVTEQNKLRYKGSVLLRTFFFVWVNLKMMRSVVLSQVMVSLVRTASPSDVWRAEKVSGCWVVMRPTVVTLRANCKLTSLQKNCTFDKKTCSLPQLVVLY